MDTVRRYRNVRALKKALRPYLSKGHPQSMNFLRQIPGFRTFTLWKMFFAGIVYAFLLLCIILALPELVGGSTASYIYLVTSCLYYVFLFFFIFDILQIRSRISWLEKSRGRWIYPVKCVLLAVIILIMVSVINGWLEKAVD